MNCSPSLANSAAGLQIMTKNDDGSADQNIDKVSDL